MATSALPSIDFEMLADLKSKMTQFTTRFDSFIAAGRDQLKREKDEFAAGLAEDRLLQQAQLEAIDRAEAKKIELLASLKTEHQEVANMEADITEYSQKRDDMLILKEALQQQLKEDTEALKTKKNQLSSQQAVLSAQNKQNMPELRMWESTLGLKLEPSEKDRIRLIFTHIAPDITKMHIILLDIASDYKVVDCYPTIDLSCLNELNEGRDFARFLRKVRNEFVALYR